MQSFNLVAICIRARFIHRRQQGAPDIDLHIALSPGPQETFHIHKVIIIFLNFRVAGLIGNGFGRSVRAGEQIDHFHYLFLEGFASIIRRHVDVALGNGAAGFAHLYLLVVLKVQLNFRTGIERQQGIVMAFRQGVNLYFRVCTVRVDAGIQVDVVGAGQGAVHFHRVMAGQIIFHLGFQHAFQAVNRPFRRQIHPDPVGAAEGDVVAVFELALLFQFRSLADDHLIVGRDVIHAVNIHIFANAAAFSLHLVGDVQVGVGIIHLALAGGHPGIFAHVHYSVSFYRLFGLYAAPVTGSHVDNAADSHGIGPGLPVIGIGDHLIACLQISLAGGEPCAFPQFGPGIHHRVIPGVGPGNADYAACTGLGGTFGRHVLKGADVGVLFHIPGPGQGCGIDGLALRIGDNRRTDVKYTAGTAVSQAFGYIVAARVEFQVFQFYTGVAGSAFGFHRAPVFAPAQRVAVGNGDQQTYGSVAQPGIAAGIVFRHQRQVRSPFCHLGNSRIPTGVFGGYIFFHGLIGFQTHAYSGFRSSLCFGSVRVYAHANRHIGTVGLGIGHIRTFPAHHGPGNHGIAQQAVAIRHDNGGRGFGPGLAVINGNANQPHVNAAGLGFKSRRIDGLQGNPAARERIAAALHLYHGASEVHGLSRVDRHIHTAGAYAVAVGNQFPGPVDLQGNCVARNRFGYLVALTVSGFLQLHSAETASAFHVDKGIGFIGIPCHADRHCQKSGRNAQHIACAPGRIADLHRQVAVGSTYGTLVQGHAGIAFGGDARIANTDSGNACLCLHGAGVDCFVVIPGHITLLGRHGHTAAFNGRTVNQNVVQLVLMIHHVGHVDRYHAQRAAAPVQVRVVPFGIVHRQGAVHSLQGRAAPDIGMDAGAAYVVTGIRPGRRLILHCLLFSIRHAGNLIGKNASGFIVHFLYCFVEHSRMAEGTAGLIILHIFQITDPVVHGNGKHIHGHA